MYDLMQGESQVEGMDYEGRGEGVGGNSKGEGERGEGAEVYWEGGMEREGTKRGGEQGGWGEEGWVYSTRDMIESIIQPPYNTASPATT